MKTIVIIDNDADSVRLLKEILEDAGYYVLGTEQIMAGLEIVKRGVHVDGIIISTLLDRKGKTLYLNMMRSHESTAGIPLIGLISSNRTVEGPEALQAGCAGVIAKPFKEPDVIKTIRAIVG